MSAPARVLSVVDGALSGWVPWHPEAGITNDGYIYLNNAATSHPKSAVAVRCFSDSLARTPGGSRHGRLSASRIETSREIVADCLAISTEHVYFTSGATLAINQVQRSVVRRGRAVAVDNRSHNAVWRAAANLPERAYLVLDLYDQTEELDRSSLNRAPVDDIALLCPTHASNVTGSLYPIAAVVAAARRRWPNIHILLDASQSAGLVDLREAVRVCDYVVFPGHKHLHALPGAAVVVSRHQLKPVIFGGTGSRGAHASPTATGPLDWEVGTSNEPAICALAGALSDATAHLHEYRQHDSMLLRELWERAQEIPELEPLGRSPGEERLGTLACRVNVGQPEIDWVPLLGDYRVVVRGGLHCSPLHHRQLHLEQSGTLRFSVGRFTTASDVSEAMARVASVGKALRELGV